MTIPVQTIFTTATANGVTTVFAFSFKIIDNDDLAVYANGIKLASGFTVSGAGNDAGGTVTFSSPPVNGTKLILTSEPELSRTTDYQQFGDFNADTVNPDFDRLWSALQFTEQVNKRSIKLPIDTATDQTIVDDAAARAGGILGFDGSGNIVVVDPVDINVVVPTITPYIQTLFDDANAAAARSTLGLADASSSLTLAGATIRQPVAPAIRLENSATSVVNNDVYGAIEFFGNDDSANANGVRAKISSISTGATGGSKLAMYAANGGSTALVEVLNAAPGGVNILQPLNVSGGIGVTGDSTLGKVALSGDFSRGYGHNSFVGYSVLYSTDTQIDIDLLNYFSLSLDIQTVAMIKVQVVGKYLNSFPAGTVYASSSRLFKQWTQMVTWDGASYQILGGVLDFAAYNSDATNFPAGAVNASKALLVANASGVWLRLQNRTSAAVGSATGFNYKVEIIVA